MKWSKFFLLLFSGIFGYGILYVVGAGILFCSSDFAILKIVSSVLYACALLFIFWRCSMAYEGSDPDDYKKHRNIKVLFVGAELALFIWALYYCIMILFHFAYLEYNTFDVCNLCVELSFLFFVAAGEEIICRGTIFRLFDKKTNFYIASIISSFAFGFFHFPNNGSTIWTCFCIAFGSGFVLSLLTKYYDSILPAIGFHWTWNFIEGYLCGNSVSGVQYENNIFKTEYLCDDLFSGSVFGPEQSIILVAINVVVSFALYIKYLPKINKLNNGNA